MGRDSISLAEYLRIIRGTESARFVADSPLIVGPPCRGEPAWNPMRIHNGVDCVLMKVVTDRDSKQLDL
jgi:hypothetical protein